MGKIIVIMGKSASGKDTIFNEIKKRHEVLENIIPYTTRPKRENEENGREYHFTDENTLKNLQQEGKVIELRTYNTMHGPWHYFTVDDGNIDLEKNSYIYIGTLEVYKNFIKYFGDENIFPIYIEIDDGKRLKRALDREMKQAHPRYAEMCRRYLSDEEDFSKEKLKEADIKKHFINNNLEQCISDIEDAICDIIV